MYDYFYGAESEQFSFYRIPEVLLTEERFRNISAEAKVLYGLLLDRMRLSAKNGWQDKENRVYIQKVHQYTGLDELTACAAHDLIKAIYIGAPDKSSGKRRQSISICYDFKGFIPLDELMKQETA